MIFYGSKQNGNLGGLFIITESTSLHFVIPPLLLLYASVSAAFYHSLFDLSVFLLLLLVKTVLPSKSTLIV
jgi:hypothetical protein